MLNKGVCKKCYLDSHKDFVNGLEKWFDEDKNEWVATRGVFPEKLVKWCENRFEKSWNKYGISICLTRYGKECDNPSVKSEFPPDWCPFVLEHSIK